MTSPKKQRPSGREARGAQLETGQRANSLDNLALAGKVVAMAIFNYGGRSLEETQRSFDERPAWRTA